MGPLLTDASARRVPAAAALSVRGLACRFGDTQALRGVDLDVRPGEIVALLGQNGAGKSTLIKILAGVYRPTAGTIRIGEQLFDRGLHAAHARDAGLAFVHQDLGLVEQLSVAENIAHVAGFQRRGRLISWRRQRALATDILRRWEFDIDPDAPVAGLEPAQRALVAIGRALATDARIVVFDEPTASLPRHDVEILFTAIDRLRGAGVAILYVTHRLGEVTRLADRVVVLRDGSEVADLAIGETSHEEIVELIVGQALAGLQLELHTPSPDRVLELEGVSAEGAWDVSLALRRGEILALVGLVGAGQGAVGRVVAGGIPASTGTMMLGGRPFRPRSPRDAQEQGVAYLPGDRVREGGFPTFSSGTNYWIRARRAASRLHPDEEQRRAAEAFADWGVTPSDPGAPFFSLSGGNQQRVLLAKWLDGERALLVVDEPTSGVDVGAREAIYRRLAASAGRGLATVLVSSDAEEVAELAHRALVFRDGRIVCELGRGELTVSRITLECARA